MTTTWYAGLALLLLVIAAILTVAFHRRWFERLAGLSPTQPSDPGDDDREAGADEDYGDELGALKAAERELQCIAEELGLDLLDPDQAQDAEDILALRLNVAELVDHFDSRMGRLLDDWQPGWWEETPTTVLPSFGAVHALIDDTSEFAAVA